MTTTIAAPTLKAAHEAAARARRLAEDAASKAVAAEQNAALAAEQAQAEADDRLRADAQRIVDTFDESLVAATERLRVARTAFNTIAVQGDSLTVIRDSYVSWQSAALGQYWLFYGLQNALGRLGLSTFRGRAIPSPSMHDEPPPFADALNVAIASSITALGADIEDRFHARLIGIEAGEVDG